MCKNVKPKQVWRFFYALKTDEFINFASFIFILFRMKGGIVVVNKRLLSVCPLPEESK